MIIELEPSFEIELVDEMISQLEDMKWHKVMDNGHYLVGNTVQYSCHEGYVLIGEPIIRCTETGLWSHAPPFCKRACRFPGDPKNGRITPVKFLYEVGDRILIQCDTGHINTGKQKLQCTQTGSWSDRLPT